VSWQAELLGINLDELEKERFDTPKNKRAHHVHKVKAAEWTEWANQKSVKLEPSNWLSLDEAAELIGYHRETILRWRKEGKLRHSMEKNKIMVDKKDVLRHAARRYTANKVTTV